MPKTELFDKKEVIKNALNLFWMKGYEATSLSELTEELGIGKGSFYNTFGSKRKLFDICLSIALEGQSNMATKLLYEENDPIQGIRKYIEMYCGGLLRDPQSRGCLIVNTSTELAHDKEIENLLREHNQNMKSILVDYLKNGNLDKPAKAIADSILIYTTGVAVLSKYTLDYNRFEISLDQFMESIEIE